MAKCGFEINYLATKQTYEMVRDYVEQELKTIKLTGEEWKDRYDVLQQMLDNAQGSLENAKAKLEMYAYDWDCKDLIEKYFSEEK